MTDLTGKLISETYKQVILVSSSTTNTGVDTSLKNVQSGDGTNTALQLATNAVKVAGTFAVSGAVSLDGNMHVDDKVCASAFYGDGLNISGLLPPGVIVPYGVTAAPTGFLLCNGQAVSRTTYSALFAVVSALYGEGNGSSTFNVPDLRGRFIAGWDAGTDVLTSVSGPANSMIVGASIANTGGIQIVTLSVSNIPAHSHTFSAKANLVGGNEGSGTVWMNTSTCDTGDTGGGGGHTNIPPSMILNFIIKT